MSSMGALSSYLLILDISREASTIERRLAPSGDLQLHDAYLARYVTPTDLPSFALPLFAPRANPTPALSSRRMSFSDAIGRCVCVAFSSLVVTPSPTERPRDVTVSCTGTATRSQHVNAWASAFLASAKNDPARRTPPVARPYRSRRRTSLAQTRLPRLACIQPRSTPAVRRVAFDVRCGRCVH